MIYLDNAATTRPCPAALDAMRTALEDAWGNPSALYRPGQQARKLVEDARRTVARVLHAALPAEGAKFRNGLHGADFVVGKHDADQAGVRLQGVRQLLRGDKPGGARRQQGYSETLRLQRL